MITLLYWIGGVFCLPLFALMIYKEYLFIKHYGFDYESLVKISLSDYNFSREPDGYYVLPHKEFNAWIGKIDYSLLFGYYHSEYGLIPKFTTLSRKINKIVKISLDPNQKIIQ